MGVTVVASGERVTVCTSRRPNEYADSVFKIYDNLDNTKKIAFEASGITTETERTLAAQDRDYTIADAADIVGVNVDSFGALGDGLTDDSAAFAACFLSVGEIGVVTLSANKTYIIGEAVDIPLGLKLIGQNSTIKRRDAYQSTLVSAELANETVFDVVDASPFSVGDNIIVCDVTLPHGGRAWNENSSTGATFNIPQSITDITGNTITVDVGLGLAMPSGSIIVKVYDMFKGEASSALPDSFGNIIDGVTFDGNVSNNNITNSWLYNKTINDLPPFSIVQNCFFKDIPSENVVVSAYCEIINNYATNLNGSFVHFSVFSGATHKGASIVSGNNLTDICQATTDVTNHSEAAVVFSANPSATSISNNIIDGCLEAAFMIHSESNTTQIFNNKCIDCNGAFRVASIDDAVSVQDFMIQGNMFKDCSFGLFDHVASLTNDLVEKGGGVDRFIIDLNEFINTKLLIQRSSDFSIRNNKFTTLDGNVWSTTDAGSDILASIGITASTHYSIINNTFDDRNETADSKLTQAINCEYDFNLELSRAQPIKTDASTETNYSYYNRNVSINNNNIINYNYGILDYFPPSQVNCARDNSWINFSIADNEITLRDVSGVYALVVGPGVYAKGNTVISTKSHSTIGPVIVMGGSDGAGAIYGTDMSALINGAIFINNVIRGANCSITVGNLHHNNFGSNRYNCEVIDNIVDGTIQDNTSGASNIVGTITLPVNETIPIQIVRSNTDFY